MVLQSSFGFPQQGYAHNEEHFNSNRSNNAYYGNSSSMQMMRPDHYSHGGFSNHGSHGYGGASSAMYSPGGAMNQGYGSHQSSHMSMGPGGYQYGSQQHGHNVSSSPYHYNSHSWASKDLDD